MKHEITLHWASRSNDPWAQTSATLYVACKPHQLKSRAGDLRELYGADSVSYSR